MDKTSLCSKGTLSELFGITERQIERLAQKKIIPAAGRGQFVFWEATQAYIRYKGAQTNSSDMPELDRRLLKAQAEEREAKARMAELDLSVMQGRLHEAGHVKKIMADMIVACRSRLLSLPSKAAATVANMTDPAEIASFLGGVVYEALEALSEYDAEEFNGLNEKYVPPSPEEESSEGENETKDA